MKRMPHPSSLTRANIIIAVRMLIYLIRIELFLSMFPYSFVKSRIFVKRLPSRPASKNKLSLLRRHISILEKVCAILWWKPSCLRRAVALRDSLFKEGIEAEIKIGVYRNNGKFEAHAWVESCNMIIFKNGDYSELNSR